MSLKNAKKVDTNRVELEVEVDAATFEAAVEAAYKKNVGRIQLPGFRKGKATRRLIEKEYGAGFFYEDAVNDVYPSALDEAIKASGYEYVEDKIDFDVTAVGAEGLSFKATITVKPEVELGDYKGIKATMTVEDVKDEDVDAELAKLQDRNSRLVVVDRAAENGDTAVFDFDGYVDDKAFDGGKAENFSLILGSGQFIPGFEEQMIGKKADEEFDVNVTFPEDYQATELAGKPAVFKCKMHEVKAKEMPELNDDFAKDCSEFDTLDALKADLKTKLEEQKKAAAEDAFEGKLVDALVDGLKADIPEAMFEHSVDESIREFDYRLQSQGLNLDTYLKYTGMDKAEFRKGFRPQAEKRVKVRLALEKIAAVEKLDLTEEELEEQFKKLAEMYKMDVEKIKSMVSAEDLKKDMVVSKAMDLVKSNVVAE